MSAQTSIQWTDRTWNPIRGCSRVSPGCDHCYAMRQARRFDTPGGPYEGLTRIGPRGVDWSGKVTLVESALLEPLTWRKPQRVFVNSMSDLFHPAVPDEWIDRIFAVMALAPRYTFQVLTKRPERMLAYLASRWPLPNVWLGVSCEDQPRADERIPLLLQTPAAIRFVSAEPLLGPIDFEAVPLPAPGADVYGLRGVLQPLTEKDAEPDDWKYWTLRSARLDWVIVGGESGPGARRCVVRWVRDVVEQCRTAQVPVFVKQLGGVVIDRNDAGFLGDEPDHWPEDISVRDAIEHDLDGTRDDCQGAPVRIHLLDRKGGDPSEWSEDLRVREFPRSAVPA